MERYSILVGLGASIGLAWVAWRTEYVEGETLAQTRHRLNAGLVALFLALIFGRVSYVAVNWEYYRTSLLEVVQLWQGGITWAGALAGGAIGLVLFAWVTHISLGYLADGLLPLMLTVTLSTWLGCWQAGCSYGAPAPGAWWALMARDELGVTVPRVPIQPLGALITLLLFLLIDMLRGRLRRHGQAASLTLLGLSTQLFIFSFLRADASPIWRGLRLDSWAGLFFLLLSILICLFAFFPTSRNIPSHSNSNV